jgi:hypothetical protein
MGAAGCGDAAFMAALTIGCNSLPHIAKLLPDPHGVTGVSPHPAHRA